MNEEITNNIITNVKKLGADAADVLLYNSEAVSVSRRMGKPEGLERSESKGISLRVFVGNRSSIVSSSDTSKQALQEISERVVAMAKLAPEDEYNGLAASELLATNIADLDLYDSNEPSVNWLQEQCRIAEDAALAVKGITNSEGADASYGKVNFTLATSTGFFGKYQSSNSSISVSVLAGSGTEMERDYDFTSARFVSELLSPESIGKKAANGAIAKLDPRKITTANMPVIFDPRVSKSLLGSFAGAINGSSIARGTSFLKDAMGKQIFANGINIIDEPHRIRGLGSKPFDGEGVANKKLHLVENGVLKSWLLDVRCANKLGLLTTGNASRGLSSPPSPSSTNLYLDAGKLSPEELIADVKSGFYVTSLFGMGINLVTGDYSQGASGFFIENGQKSYAVSEVTIAGKLVDMFSGLTPANDLNFQYATNSPTIRIENMMVAGK